MLRKELNLNKIYSFRIIYIMLIITVNWNYKNLKISL